jgi:hypothetical protein
MDDKVRSALAIVLAAAGAARADVSPADAARATKLFDQGHKLIDAGKIDDACDAFAQSLALDPEIGTALNLADCRERQGKLVEARALFDAAAVEAMKTNKEGRATFARGRIAELDKRLAHVTVRAPAGVRVALDGRPIDASVQHVMPGTIAIDASAPGKKPWRHEQSVAAGETVAIEADLVDEPGPTARPPVPPPAQRTPLVITATGGALVVASAVVGLHARARWSDAIDRGDKDGVTGAQHEADLATGIVVVGLATAAVGVYLYLRPSHRGVVVVPTTDGASAGMLAAGSF